MIQERKRFSFGKIDLGIRLAALLGQCVDANFTIIGQQ